MFTSGNNQNPFSYSTETFFKQLYSTYDDDDQNPNSAQDQDSPFMINFSTSPNFLDDHQLPLSQILHQQQPLANHGQNENMTISNSASMGINSSTEMANEAPVETKPSRKRNIGTVPRKRTGKKDRHSKICTAQGIRDRRMRLSLQIARKFFDLQDMLGFDKASKTIEWLFSKSKKAIKELGENNVLKTKDNSSCSKQNSDSFMSECEVVSGMEENSNNQGRKAIMAAIVDDPYEKENRKLQKVAYDFQLAKESREKARARARERTKEKMMIKSLEKTKQLYESSSNPSNLEQLGSFIQTLEESNSCTKKCSSNNSNSTEHHQFADVGINGNNYLGSENFTQIAASPFFSYHNTNELSRVVDFNHVYVGFDENWDNNTFRINSSNDSITNNMVSQAGNYHASTSLASSKFPFNLQ